MSNNQLRMDGIAELREALRRLPDELKGEARHIVEGAANGAAAEIGAQYAVRTGHLRDGLQVRFSEISHFGAGAILLNRAKHAWLYDNGSEARHYFTKSGAKHETGAMWGRTPPTHLFVRTVIRKRRQMYEALKDLLTRNGFEVSGDAE